MHVLIALLFFGSGICFASSAKILVIFPIPARSHCILGSALGKGLAEKGHDVTMISPFPEKDLPKNGSYRDIVLTGLAEDRNKKHSDVNMFEMGEKSPFIFFPFVAQMMVGLTDVFFKHPNVQTLLNSDEKFDLVIVEQFFTEAHKGFANHFNAPLIIFNTIGANTWSNILVANPAPPSYIPEALLSFSSDMTFTQRLYNSAFQLYTNLWFNFYIWPRQKLAFDEHFPNLPNFYDIIYNSSLLLLNSHNSINQPVPYVPNMIDIGGFHVQPPKKLPQDIQEFLDNAKEGVIYFSMGSNLKSSEFPVAKREAFLKTFAKLKQKILWKWEEDVLPGQPDNVKLGKWLPQQDILAHPNVKVFITHGGLLSTIETIYHGVPVLSLPITADQKMNAQNVANQGYGIMLTYREISEESLTQKLHELLTQDKYSKMAKVRSKLFHDRLVKPMDTAIYWIEYIIRHGGAPHLQVAGVNLPWYQYLLIDVIVFVFIVSLSVSFIICLLVKKIVMSCFSKSKKKVKKN